MMKNNVKLLLASIAGILVFNTAFASDKKSGKLNTAQGFDALESMLANRTLPTVPPAPPTLQKSISPAENIKNEFFIENTNKSVLISGLLTREGKSLLFKETKCAELYHTINGFIETRFSSSEAAEKREAITLIFSELLAEMGQSLFSYSKESFAALGDTSGLTPEEIEERQGIARKNKIAANGKSIFGSQTPSNPEAQAADQKKLAQKMQKRKEIQEQMEKQALMAPSTTPEDRSAASGVSPSNSQSIEGSGSVAFLPFPVTLKSTPNKANRYSTSSVTSNDTSNGFSSAHSSLSRMSNSSSARTSPEFRTPTPKLNTPTTELTIDDLM